MSKESCWLQVSSGRGPVECQRAVVRISEKIVDEAIEAGLEARTIEVQSGEKKGTALSALISVSGFQLEQFTRQWKGSVLWICESPYRPNHKRKNWFVSVNIITPDEAGGISIKPKDITIEVFRASGPGGQHVNTTDSAVRIKHKPSGLMVVSSAERSQFMNKKLAMARLAEKLANIQEEKKKDSKKDQWGQHNTLQRGDALRVFEGRSFREK